MKCQRPLYRPSECDLLAVLNHCALLPLLDRRRTTQTMNPVDYTGMPAAALRKYL
jgi:hypothetical protein